MSRSSFKFMGPRSRLRQQKTAACRFVLLSVTDHFCICCGICFFNLCTGIFCIKVVFSTLRLLLCLIYFASSLYCFDF